MNPGVFACIHTDSLGPRQSTTFANGVCKYFALSPQPGSVSSALGSLADLVLYYSWLPLLNDKAARPYEDSGLEPFQLLVSCLKLHIDDWIDGQILGRNWKESRRNTIGAKLRKSENRNGGLRKHLHELPNAVVFASGLPPKTSPSSSVISTTPL